MSKPTDIRVVDARLEIEPLSFRAPLKFGGRVVEHYQIVNVSITAETRSGKRGVGLGSMPIGHIWAWPTQEEPSKTEQAMKLLSESLTEAARDFTEFAHPIDLGLLLAERIEPLSKKATESAGIKESMPRLAGLVAASPVDAALHDAFGKANSANSYNLLSDREMNHDLSMYLDRSFAGEYLDQYTLRQPKARMPLYHLVGALDPLTDADVRSRIPDDLPQTLEEWIPFNGLTHLKIKLAGDQLDWDVDRVAAVEAVAKEAQSNRGCQAWHYSLDFNERCADVNYVLEFLRRVAEKSPTALDRVQYIEQPTHRDLKTHGTPMHEAARIKPVVIDESLVDYESLLLARELGYTGVALKACKGQTESLLMAAAAQKQGMFLCVQDLTCPGASFLHSAGMAARIPGIAAIEGNARQYCPSGNVEWAERFPGIFQIKEGTVETASLTGNGLGH